MVGLAISMMKTVWQARFYYVARYNMQGGLVWGFAIQLEQSPDCFAWPFVEFLVNGSTNIGSETRPTSLHLAMLRWAIDEQDKTGRNKERRNTHVSSVTGRVRPAGVLRTSPVNEGVHVKAGMSNMSSALMGAKAQQPMQRAPNS